ncbi:MAG: hypothetical protein WKG52_07490 [Variovorax sp.]
MNSIAASYTQASSRPTALSRAGQMFIAVFLIIVLEGAVRKWASSSSTLPLILLRDLIAVGLVLYAWRGGHLRRQSKIAAAMLAWSCVVFGWGLLQLVGGESTPTIFIIGLRFWLLYTWFAVAAAASMNEADYRASIWTAGILMLALAPLAALQFYSPPGARINTQLEGDEGDVFVAIAGVVRATATFSFTSGYATFLGMVAPIALGLLGARKRTTRQQVFAISVFMAFVVGTLVSGSRAATITSAVMFLAYLFGRLLFSKMRKKPAAAVAVVLALAVAAVFAYVFQGAIGVTQERFEQAAAAEDFAGRVLAILFAGPGIYDAITWLGSGIGYGSNLATYVRTGANAAFALAETEGGRILLEGGLLGIAFSVLKVVVVTLGMAKSIRIAAKTNSPFPMLVWLTASLAIVTWSAIGQLTSNALLGIVLTYALLVLRYPRFEFFPPRASRT